VAYDDPVFAAASFHHAEVAKWLTEMHPPWLGFVRRFAREWRLFDILAHLPEAAETLLPFDGLLGAHVEAMDRLGIPLGFAVWAFGSDEVFDSTTFDADMCREAPSLLLAEAEGGSVFGAFVAIRWPKFDSSTTDRWCGSFLFTIDGAEAKRFPAVTPPMIAHSNGKVSIGELTLDLLKNEFSIDETHRCTAAPLQFPVSAGKLTDWGLWAL
jgi:hypothetical protein